MDETNVGKEDLTMRLFSQVNWCRCKNWHDPMEWSMDDWAVAMAGEAGELCNVVKKLTRADQGIAGNKETRAELLQQFGEEIADVYTYLDLLAQRQGLDMQDLVVKKFNKVSERNGFSEKFGEQFHD